MIHIQEVRFGPLLVVLTVNDYREATVAIGLTSSAAHRRLHRKLDTEAQR